MLRNQLLRYEALLLREYIDEEADPELRLFYQDHLRGINLALRSAPMRPRDFRRWCQYQRRHRPYTTCIWNDLLSIVNKDFVVSSQGDIRTRALLRYPNAP